MLVVYGRKHQTSNVQVNGMKPRVAFLSALLAVLCRVTWSQGGLTNTPPGAVVLQPLAGDDWRFLSEIKSNHPLCVITFSDRRSQSEILAVSDPACVHNGFTRYVDGMCGLGARLCREYAGSGSGVTVSFLWDGDPKLTRLSFYGMNSAVAKAWESEVLKGLRDNLGAKSLKVELRPDVAIATDFVTGAALNSNELEQVLRLAHFCGMKDVAEVSTFTFHPAGYPGIRAKSSEKISGRHVYFETLVVERDAWTKRKNRDPIAKAVGEFWAPGGRVTKHDLTIFTAGQVSTRVYLSGRIPLSSADTIMQSFLQKTVQFERESDASEVLKVDFSTPARLESRGADGYALYYRDYCISFKVPGGQVRVTGFTRVLP